MKRVAFVQFLNYPCVRSRKIVRSLLNNGYEVTYVGNNRGREVAIESSIAGARIVHCGKATPVKSRLKAIYLFAYFVEVFLFLRRERPEVVYAVDLDGVMGAVIARLIGVRFFLIFDVYDTYSIRYRLPRIIERLIARVEKFCADHADLVVHVDEVRVITVPSDTQALVVRNVPSALDWTISPQPIKAKSRINKLTILLSGSLEWARGIRQIVDAAKLVEGVKVIAMGTGSTEPVEYIRKQHCCEYIGSVSSLEALKVSSTVDLITAYYDPGIKINVMASPNKLYDAMATGKGILVNSELLVAESVVRTGIGFAVPYFDVGQLSDLFRKLSETPAILEETGERGLSLFSEIGGWEREFAPVIKLMAEHTVSN